jgi:hypothetical protein
VPLVRIFHGIPELSWSELKLDRGLEVARAPVHQYNNPLGTNATIIRTGQKGTLPPDNVWTIAVRLVFVEPLQNPWLDYQRDHFEREATCNVFDDAGWLSSLQISSIFSQCRLESEHSLVSATLTPT